MKIAIFTGMRSCTIVAISCMFIWKPPSPEIAQTGSSGPRERDAHGRGHREPHGAEAARGDVGVGPLVAEQLGHPHLVLPHVGDDGASAGARLLERRQDPLGREPALEAVHPRPHEARDLAPPACRSRAARWPRAARAGWRRASPTSPTVTGTFLPISDGSSSMWMTLAPRAKAARLPVTRSSNRSPTPMMQVGLLDGAVHVHLAVHPRHAEVQRVRLGKRADAEQRGDDRDAGALGERAELGVGVAQDDAVARHDQRPLGAGR